jgi:hypothetical protein
MLFDIFLLKGNEHEENGLFEAPIVFIQPTGTFSMLESNVKT